MKIKVTYSTNQLFGIFLLADDAGVIYDLTDKGVFNDLNATPDAIDFLRTCSVGSLIEFDGINYYFEKTDTDEWTMIDEDLIKPVCISK